MHTVGASPATNQCGMWIQRFQDGVRTDLVDGTSNFFYHPGGLSFSGVWHRWRFSVVTAESGVAALKAECYWNGNWYVAAGDRDGDPLPAGGAGVFISAENGKNIMIDEVGINSLSYP